MGRCPQWEILDPPLPLPLPLELNPFPLPLFSSQPPLPHYFLPFLHFQTLQPLHPCVQTKSLKLATGADIY